MAETRKKTKCDMNICEFIRDIEFPEIEQKKNVYVDSSTDQEDIYRKNLDKYIHLCEITSELSKKYRTNYIANINFILNKLNFKLYFEETETLETLKNRINIKCKPKKQYVSKFPIRLIDYPDNLGVIPAKKRFKKSSKKTTYLKYIKKYAEDSDEEKKDNSDSESDADSAEADNTFDIDNYESEEEYDDMDDGGAFSD